MIFQAVDHPYLVVYSEAAAQRSEEVSTDKEICSVCLHPSVVAFVGFFAFFFVFT